MIYKQIKKAPADGAAGMRESLSLRFAASKEVAPSRRSDIGNLVNLRNRQRRRISAAALSEFLAEPAANKKSACRRQPLFLDGGRCSTFEEPLVAIKQYTAQWFRREIDLGELARLRFEERWTQERLAAHFGVPRTTLMGKMKGLTKR